MIGGRRRRGFATAVLLASLGAGASEPGPPGEPKESAARVGSTSEAGADPGSAVESMATAATAPADAAATGPPPLQPGCVRSPSGMVSLSLETVIRQRRGRVQLDRTAECLQTTDLPLPAALLELPAYTEPYSIRIESLVTDSFVLPRIEFYDATMTRTREFAPDSFARRGSAVSVQLFVNAGDAGERYLLLYPDPARLGDADTRLRAGVGTACIGTGFVFFGTENRQVAHVVDRGTLVFTLIGDRWQKPAGR